MISNTIEQGKKQGELSSLNKWTDAGCPKHMKGWKTSLKNATMKADAVRRLIAREAHPKGAVTCLSIADCFFLLRLPLSPLPDGFLLCGFIQNSITFEEGSEREMGHSRHSRGSKLAPRNASPLTQTILATREWGRAALLRLARWILRWWFIRISHFKPVSACHTFSWAIYSEGTLLLADVSRWLFISS